MKSSRNRYGLVIAATFVLWVGLVVARGVLRLPDTSSPAAPAAYFIRDPYCIVDPTCVSPFFSPSKASTSDTHWQGFGWMPADYDTAQINSSGLEYLSPINYLAFWLLMVLLSLGTRAIRNARRRSGAEVALFTWACLNVIPWFGAANPLGPMEGYGWVCYAAGALTLAMTEGSMLAAMRVRTRS